MKTKEEIQSEAEWRFTDGHGATDQYCVKMFVSACEWMQESIQQEWIPVEVRLPDDGELLVWGTL
jgi:hypothetical protein